MKKIFKFLSKAVVLILGGGVFLFLDGIIFAVSTKCLFCGGGFVKFILSPGSLFYGLYNLLFH